MIYMGSKGRLAKELAPIIQSYITPYTKGYIEPFVGGGNMIDKIQCDNKIGYDIEKYVIACLDALSKGWEPPKEVTEREYKEIKANISKYPDYLVGYIGYQLSFGANFFSGYVKRCDKKHHGDIYSYASCMKQAPNLSGVQFINSSYKTIDTNLEGYVIYCDPPYRNTSGYRCGGFDYNYFYNWCMKMAKKNTVLISEYFMPKEFELLWEKGVKVTLNNTSMLGKDRIEKLFKA